ncbi:MAG TPA: ATP synthase F0 subunit B [Candidatus Angelobacter sp.]|nr:ATP synthase F0 subunit B [Candidatus Angelobacter sp.]
MISRLSRLFSAGLCALLLLAAMCSFAPMHAQESSKPPVAEQPRQAQEPQAQEHEPGGEGKNKSQEQGGEESNPIRNSPAVQWISAKTGLTIDQAYWLCIGINFGVVFIFIVVMLRKKLPGYFSGRTAAIQKGIEEARKMSEEARQRLSDVEGRLSRLDADIAAMRSEADQNARAEEQRIQASSEEERKRIVSSAEQEISTAASAARRDLKSYVAELAVDLAQKKIRVEKDADQALVHEFTTRLGKDGN